MNTATSWTNESTGETDEKDEANERLSGFANQMNRLTLDLEAEIYSPAKPDTRIYNDMERNCPD